jgi:cell division protein FtsQ
MDGGGRKLRSLDGPLKAVGDVGRPLTAERRTVVYRTEPRLGKAPNQVRPALPQRPARRPERTWLDRLTRPGMGWLGAFLFLAATGSYGATLGNHWQGMAEAAVVMPDAFARGSGFTIERIDVDGRKILTDDEILTAIGAQVSQSLLFVDADAARERLLQNPLVMTASVRKLYPHTLSVSVTERQPYALWQRGEKLAVIASDGTVIDGVEQGRFADLPLVVGRGAESQVKAILAALEPYPELRSKVYAAVFVGGRRWNLRLTNGMDVKLPVEGFEQALANFVELDRTSKLSERDITEVDFRLPDHVTVRLSDAAAAADAEAKKEKSKRAGT